MTEITRSKPTSWPLSKVVALASKRDGRTISRIQTRQTAQTWWRATTTRWCLTATQWRACFGLFASLGMFQPYTH